MKKVIYSIFATVILFGCTTDFEEINTNPNAPGDVQPATLLRQVIYNYGEEMSYEGFVAGNLLGQYLTALDFNLFDRHALKSPQLGGNPWPIIYKNLRDNEIVLKKAQTTEVFAVYEGPALIFKAYMTAALTDLYGDVPYSEAFRGTEGSVTAVYDSQQMIYTAEGGILDNLEKGIAAIENYTGNNELEGDVLYNGNLNNWIKFANSLRIKALMRISAKEDVSTRLQAIYDAGNFISTNADNAVFNFSPNEPNNFRMARLRAGDFNNFVMSETMENTLVGLADRRIRKLFRPFANSGIAYNGLQNGIDAANTTISLSDYSLAGTIFREDAGNLKANYMTAWETNFLLAEASLKGVITAAPGTLYNAGVTQAFQYWEVTLPTNYLATTAALGAAGSNPIEQVLTQKWIANMINGYEGWIEYRRTGFPQLNQVSASLNGNMIPVRMPYPAEEAALNTVNYNTAAAATDNNSINSPVWWDE